MRLLSLVLITTIVSFLFVSSRADASCGDYLSHKNMTSDAQTVVFEQGDHSGVVPFSQRSSAPRSCRGPFCKQAPTQSPRSTPIVSVDPQERWIWAAEDLVPIVGESAFFTHRGDRVELLAIAFRLERPPKI